MAIVQAVAEALQRSLGEPLDQLGRDSGVIRRRRKFSGSTLVQALVLTLPRRPRARPEDYAATAALLGVEVTPRAVAKRFTPSLVEMLRDVLGLLLARAVAAAPDAAGALAGFDGVYLGDGTTIPLPEEYAGEFPACGGAAGQGRAAMELQVVWDLVTGGLMRLSPGPGRSSDAAEEVAARRRQKAYERARDRGRVPSAGHLAACGWTAFVTDRPAESLSWKAAVVLYRARWQVENSHSQCPSRRNLSQAA
jgi:hypothetical protein